MQHYAVVNAFPTANQIVQKEMLSPRDYIPYKREPPVFFFPPASYSKSSGLLTGDALEDELSVPDLSPVGTPGARLRLFRMKPPVLAPVACLLPILSLSRSGSRVLTGA